MPQLTIKGTNVEKLYGLTNELKNILSTNASADMKYVKIDFVPTIQFDENDSFLKLEILWLRGRTQLVQDKTAKALTDYFMSNGYDFVQITFTNMPPADFYENGVHY